MSHLNPETLARLIDEPTTEAEAGHLALCTMCTGELDAMRAEHDALGALPRILPVPTSWEVMRHRLEREGMLRSAAPARAAWLPSMAAALALFIAGGVTGVALAGDWGGSRAVAVGSDPAPVSAGTVDAGLAAALDSAFEEGVASAPEAARPAPAQLARQAAAPVVESPIRQAALEEEEELPSLYGVPAGPNWDAIARRASTAKTPDEAARFVRDAEGAYLAAMTRLAELTSAQSSDPAVRLATLDGIVVTTGAALERSPADPVINGYYLAARAQRDALLRTVSSSPEQDPWY